MKPLIAFFFGIVLLGCNSKKRAVDKAIHEEKRNVILSRINDITTNAKITRQVNTTTYTPIDPNKLILVDGKEITNATVSKKEETEYKNLTTIDKSKIDKSDKTETFDKTKSVDLDKKTTPFWMWVIGGVVVIVGGAMYFGKSLRKPFSS